MKKLIFVLIALVNLTANAFQGYEPIVKEGRQWVYRFSYRSQITGKESILPMVFEFKGDTIINGNTYKKCYRTIMGNDIARGTEYGDYIITDEPMLIACCREFTVENISRTYVTAIFSQEYKDEMVGYDNCTMPLNIFSRPDDTYESIVYSLIAKDNKFEFNGISSNYGEFGQPLFYFYTYNSSGVRLRGIERNALSFTSMDTILVGNQPRLHIFREEKESLSGGMEYYKYRSHWIESIGYISSLDNAGNFLSIGAIFRYLDYEYSCNVLSHVIENGNIIYKSYMYDPRVDFTSTSSVDDVKVTTLPNDNMYYNLQGQAVDIKSAPAGIYIHNGKKVVVK